MRHQGKAVLIWAALSVLGCDPDVEPRQVPDFRWHNLPVDEGVWDTGVVEDASVAGRPRPSDPIVDEELAPPDVLPPTKSIHVRVWNTRASDGRHTHVSREDVELFFGHVDEMIGQCGRPIRVVPVSIGSVLTPQQCWGMRMTDEDPSLPERIDCRRLWGGGVRDFRTALVQSGYPVGQIDLFVHPRWEQGITRVLGFAPQPGQHVHVTQQGLETGGWKEFSRTIAHEIGHNLGAYPEDAADYGFEGHLSFGAPLCSSFEPLQRGLMCSSAGALMDIVSCEQFNESAPGSPMNMTEQCNDRDDDFDGSFDEGGHCE